MKKKILLMMLFFLTVLKIGSQTKIDEKKYLNQLEEYFYSQRNNYNFNEWKSLMMENGDFIFQRWERDYFIKIQEEDTNIDEMNDEKLNLKEKIQIEVENELIRKIVKYSNMQIPTDLLEKVKNNIYDLKNKSDDSELDVIELLWEKAENTVNQFIDENILKKKNNLIYEYDNNFSEKTLEKYIEQVSTNAFKKSQNAVTQFYLTEKNKYFYTIRHDVSSTRRDTENLSSEEVNYAILDNAVAASESLLGNIQENIENGVPINIDTENKISELVKIWENAEDALILNRISIEDDFDESEEDLYLEWEKVYEKIIQNKNDAMNKLREIYVEGIDNWSNYEKMTVDEISNKREMFEKEISQRLEVWNTYSYNVRNILKNGSMSIDKTYSDIEWMEDYYRNLKDTGFASEKDLLELQEQIAFRKNTIQRMKSLISNYENNFHNNYLFGTDVDGLMIENNSEKYYEYYDENGELVFSGKYKNTNEMFWIPYDDLKIRLAFLEKKYLERKLNAAEQLYEYAVNENERLSKEELDDQYSAVKSKYLKIYNEYQKFSKYCNEDSYNEIENENNNLEIYKEALAKIEKEFKEIQTEFSNFSLHYHLHPDSAEKDALKMINHAKEEILVLFQNEAEQSKDYIGNKIELAKIESNNEYLNKLYYIYNNLSLVQKEKTEILKINTKYNDIEKCDNLIYEWGIFKNKINIQESLLKNIYMDIDSLVEKLADQIYFYNTAQIKDKVNYENNILRIKDEIEIKLSSSESALNSFDTILNKASKKTDLKQIENIYINKNNELYEQYYNSKINYYNIALNEIIEIAENSISIESFKNNLQNSEIAYHYQYFDNIDNDYKIEDLRIMLKDDKMIFDTVNRYFLSGGTVLKINDVIEKCFIENRIYINKFNKLNITVTEGFEKKNIYQKELELLLKIKQKYIDDFDCDYINIDYESQVLKSRVNSNSMIIEFLETYNREHDIGIYKNVNSDIENLSNLDELKHEANKRLEKDSLSSYNDIKEILKKISTAENLLQNIVSKDQALQFYSNKISNLQNIINSFQNVLVDGNNNSIASLNKYSNDLYELENVAAEYLKDNELKMLFDMYNDALREFKISIIAADLIDEEINYNNITKEKILDVCENNKLDIEYSEDLKNEIMKIYENYEMFSNNSFLDTLSLVIKSENDYNKVVDNYNLSDNQKKYLYTRYTGETLSNESMVVDQLSSLKFYKAKILNLKNYIFQKISSENSIITEIYEDINEYKYVELIVNQIFSEDNMKNYYSVIDTDEDNFEVIDSYVTDDLKSGKYYYFQGENYEIKNYILELTNNLKRDLLSNDCNYKDYSEDNTKIIIDKLKNDINNLSSKLNERKALNENHNSKYANIIKIIIDNRDLIDDLQDSYYQNEDVYNDLKKKYYDKSQERETIISIITGIEDKLMDLQELYVSNLGLMSAFHQELEKVHNEYLLIKDIYEYASNALLFKNSEESGIYNESDIENYYTDVKKKYELVLDNYNSLIEERNINKNNEIYIQCQKKSKDYKYATELSVKIELISKKIDEKKKAYLNKIDLLEKEKRNNIIDMFGSYSDETKDLFEQIIKYYSNTDFNRPENKLSQDLQNYSMYYNEHEDELFKTEGVIDVEGGNEIFSTDSPLLDLISGYTEESISVSNIFSQYAHTYLLNKTAFGGVFYPSLPNVILRIRIFERFNFSIR